MHSCFKCLAHPSRWMAGLSVLYISFIFLLFMRKFKILLPFFFEAFWINIMYLVMQKMKSILKMNFLLNIETYTFAVIKYQEQLFVYNTLVENWNNVTFLGLSIMFPYVLTHIEQSILL